MSTVVCWFQRTLKQLEREQTDRQTDRYTDRQDNYSNPRACAPRVNYMNTHTHTPHPNTALNGQPTRLLTATAKVATYEKGIYFAYVKQHTHSHMFTLYHLKVPYLAYTVQNTQYIYSQCSLSGAKPLLRSSRDTWRRRKGGRRGMLCTFHNCRPAERESFEPRLAQISHLQPFNCREATNIEN